MSTDKVTITVKLRLKDKHSAELERQARAVNFVWNYCNETSRKAWDRDRKWLSKYELQSLTAGTSKELGIHCQTIQRVCHQFVDARNRAKRAGLRWRGRKSLGWIPFAQRTISFDGKAFIFLSRRLETMHGHPALAPGVRLLSGSLSRDSRGRWYVNAPVEIDKRVSDLASVVGVDLGLKHLATLSDGTKIDMPGFYRKHEERLATSQRSRKTKRSRYIHAKIANRRRDYLHKASLAVATSHHTIIIGDVPPTRIAQTRMAKSVYDAGWSDLKRMISYKALMHGGRMIEVSERLTTQTCSHCGSLPPERPKGIAGLGIREWECSECGAVHDRDVNAARNILRIGLNTLAEGAVA